MVGEEREEVMERICINTRCMSCEYFEEKGTIQIPKRINLISYGICGIWCHKVFGNEFCSRGKNDKNWIDRQGGKKK